MSQVVIGIESTAHTAGVGVITSDGKTLSNQRSVYVPEEGGIHPREAANHHSESLPGLFKAALKEAKLEPGDISLVSYARGPGLGPCLRTGATAAVRGHVMIHVSINSSGCKLTSCGNL